MKGFKTLFNNHYKNVCRLVCQEAIFRSKICSATFLWQIYTARLLLTTTSHLSSFSARALYNALNNYASPLLSRRQININCRELPEILSECSTVRWLLGKPSKKCWNIFNWKMVFFQKLLHWWSSIKIFFFFKIDH